MVPRKAIVLRKAAESYYESGGFLTAVRDVTSSAMGRKPKFAHRGTTVSFRIDEETYAERKEEIRRAITETIAKFERDRASGSPPSIEAPAIEPKKSEIEELYDEFGDFVDERADPALKEVAKTRKKS